MSQEEIKIEIGEEELKERHSIILANVKRELSHIDSIGIHARLNYYRQLNKKRKKQIFDRGVEKISDFNNWNEVEKGILYPRILGVTAFFGVSFFPVLNAFFKRGTANYGSPGKRFVVFIGGFFSGFMVMSESCSYIGMREDIKYNHGGDFTIDELDDL